MSTIYRLRNRVARINQEKTQDRSNGSGLPVRTGTKNIRSAMINDLPKRGSYNIPQISERVVAGVDWLSATSQLSWASLGALKSDLAAHWSMAASEFFIPTDGSYRGRRYQAGVKSPNGVDVLWRSVEGSDLLDCRVEIKGSAIGCLSLEGEFNLFQFLFKKWKFKPTRCDFRADFYNLDGQDILANVEESSKNGNYMNYHQHSIYTKMTKTGKCVGRTVYLGSTKSRCFTRWYDKGLESGINEDWVRCETQTRESAAVNHVQALLNMIDSVSDCLLEVYEKICGELALMGSEFRQRPSDSSDHLTRDNLPYLQWYKELLDKFGQCVGYVKRTQPRTKFLDRSLLWIEKQCSQTLAALVEVCDLHWLLQLLEDAQRNYSRTTKSKIAYWRLELAAQFPPQPSSLPASATTRP